MYESHDLNGENKNQSFSYFLQYFLSWVPDEFCIEWLSGLLLYLISTQLIGESLDLFC